MSQCSWWAVCLGLDKTRETGFLGLAPRNSVTTVGVTPKQKGILISPVAEKTQTPSPGAQHVEGGQGLLTKHSNSQSSDPTFEVRPLTGGVPTGSAEAGWRAGAQGGRVARSG